ncbi:MAG: CDP-alcohol phosphatidyltransferase family protein [Desulfobacterales bacterium]|nr:MAG: CDP-alcohol phosphatidyltransferase family protein [Desulfobacterales bacterium]
MGSITWNELRKKCKRESDYIITLFVTNELSLLLTWKLANTRITPNQVTVSSILCGLACSICYAFGEFLAGSLLLFVSHILDCTDGNLARAKSSFSPIGKWLDMSGDRIAEAMVFTGTAFYFIKTGASEFWIVLSLVDAILLSAYYYMVDIALAQGLSKPVQNVGGLKFKDVRVKWGLLEPVIYGFVLLAPFGLIKIQIAAVFVISLFGICFQVAKRISDVRSVSNSE